MRFCPLQRLPARDALDQSGHALIRSRFGVLSSVSSPARPRINTSKACRPCGFSPCEHDAVKLDDADVFAACFLATINGAAWTRRLNGCIGNVSDVCRSLARGRFGASDCVALTRTRHIKRHRFIRSQDRSRSCIAAYLHAMFRYRLEPSRPGRDGLILPSSRLDGAPGVRSTLRRVAPVAGG